MKIRFSKTLAAVLAATTVTAISGISALASVTTVVTYDAETYVYGEDNNVTVTSTVTSTDEEGQVTYLVATATPSVEGAIKYIDQAPIAKGGTVEFEFTTKENTLYSTDVVSAKFGSDCSVGVDTFAFQNGVDYFTAGVASVAKVSEPVVTSGGAFFYGELSGNATEYGVEIGTTKYKALGTVDGIFCVALDGATAEDIAGAKLYAIKTNGDIVYAE